MDVKLTINNHFLTPNHPRTDEDIYAWDETKAVCTSKYSEISPLQGGVVTFSPLKGQFTALK